MQPGDDPPEPFSVLTDRITTPQIQCGITRTTPATHDVIRANVHRSPMYSGQIQSRGPRYCPSIEDKIVRFGDRDGHQIFLEPEGLDDTTVYPNGISTSLPRRGAAGDPVRRFPGCEQVRMVRPGYAIEYDHVDPRELDPTLADQAAAAGCSWPGRSTAPPAMRRPPPRDWWRASMPPARAGGGAPIVFDRADGYLGVMIDDLVTRGITEPYRMFTSRAEYRLTLRADNADQRLTDKGIALGCVGAGARQPPPGQDGGARRRPRPWPDRWHLTPTEAAAPWRCMLNRDGQRRSAFELLAYPEIGWAELSRIWPELSARSTQRSPVISRSTPNTMSISSARAPTSRPSGATRGCVLAEVDYEAVPGLSNEARQKLAAARPRTVGQAGRLDGITPAALAILAAYLRRQDRAAALLRRRR